MLFLVSRHARHGERRRLEDGRPHGWLRSTWSASSTEDSQQEDTCRKRLLYIHIVRHQGFSSPLQVEQGHVRVGRHWGLSELHDIATGGLRGAAYRSQCKQ